MVVFAEEDRVNLGKTISKNGQASHNRRRGASQTTEVDGMDAHCTGGKAFMAGSTPNGSRVLGS